MRDSQDTLYKYPDSQDASQLIISKNNFVATLGEIAGGPWQKSECENVRFLAISCDFGRYGTIRCDFALNQGWPGEKIAQFRKKSPPRQPKIARNSVISRGIAPNRKESQRIEKEEK